MQLRPWSHHPACCRVGRDRRRTFKGGLRAFLCCRRPRRKARVGLQDWSNAGRARKRKRRIPAHQAGVCSCSPGHGRIILHAAGLQGLRRTFEGGLRAFMRCRRLRRKAQGRLAGLEQRREGAEAGKGAFRRIRDLRLQPRLWSHHPACCRVGRDCAEDF